MKNLLVGVGALLLTLGVSGVAEAGEVHYCGSECYAWVGHQQQAEDNGPENALSCDDPGVAHYLKDNDGNSVTVNTPVFGNDSTAGWWASYACNHSYLYSLGSGADCYGKPGPGCNFNCGPVTNNATIHDFYTRKHGMFSKQAKSTFGPAGSDWGGCVAGGVTSTLKKIKSGVSGVIDWGKKILGF